MARRSGAAATMGLVVIVLMPIVYVLSIGPAVWLCHGLSCDSVGPALEVFYAPLRTLRDTAAWPALDWWVRRWR